jgi:cytochrome c oxidase subunit I+III
VPLYVSGPVAPGWWAMFITMMADATAFSGLVFGYYFYWTARPDFPPAGPGLNGPGAFWPMMALAFALAGWAATLAAREINKRGGVAAARLLLAAGIVLSLGGAAAGLAGPWASGLDPALHAYPAIVWTLAGWAAAHSVTGAIMQGYTLARSLAGKMTPTHDADLRNITVFQHFMALTALVAFPTIGLFPGVA